MFRQHKIVAMVVDDAHFLDGKLTAAMLSVPLNDKGLWLGFTPLVVNYPDTVIDLDEKPIEARLFTALHSKKPRKSHADPLASTWIHIQAIHKILASVLELGYQEFDSADNYPISLVEAGEHYELDAASGKAFVVRGDRRVPHVSAPNIHQPTLYRMHDQESALFGSHVHRIMRGSREVLCTDQSHIETRVLRNTSTYAGLTNHDAKVLQFVCVARRCIQTSDHSNIRTLNHSSAQSIKHSPQSNIQAFRHVHLQHLQTVIHSVQPFEHSNLQTFKLFNHTSINAFKIPPFNYSRHPRIQTFTRSNIQTVKHLHIQTCKHSIKRTDTQT